MSYWRQNWSKIIWTRMCQETVDSSDFLPWFQQLLETEFKTVLVYSRCRTCQKDTKQSCEKKQEEKKTCKHKLNSFSWRSSLRRKSSSKNLGRTLLQLLRCWMETGKVGRIRLWPCKVGSKEWFNLLTLFPIECLWDNEGCRSQTGRNRACRFHKSSRASDDLGLCSIG